jgi:hypothetical protein
MQDILSRAFCEESSISKWRVGVLEGSSGKSVKSFERHWVGGRARYWDLEVRFEGVQIATLMLLPVYYFAEGFQAGRSVRCPLWQWVFASSSREKRIYFLRVEFLLRVIFGAVRV